MSTENYFCSAMIQWPAMLLNNGGTLSSYALKKKKKNILKYRESQNIIEQITKTKGNVTYKKKKKILFKELFIIQVSKIKVIIQCLLSNI